MKAFSPNYQTIAVCLVVLFPLLRVALAASEPKPEANAETCKKFKLCASKNCNEVNKDLPNPLPGDQCKGLVSGCCALEAKAKAEEDANSAKNKTQAAAADANNWLKSFGYITFACIGVVVVIVIVVVVWYCHKKKKREAQGHH